MEVLGGDGEEVRVVVRVGLIQVAIDHIQGGRQIVGRGPDGVPAARLGQQVEQGAHRVHQQLFGQQSQHAPPHGVVLLVAQIIKLVRGDGGALAAEGAAQQKVGGHPVIVAGLYHKGQTRLPDAVFIVRQQRLGDAQHPRGGALTDPLLLSQQGQGAGKFFVHKQSPQKFAIHLV